VVGAAFVEAGTIFNTLGLSDVGNVVIIIGLVITAIASIALTTLEAAALMSKYKLVNTITNKISQAAPKAVKANTVKAAYETTYKTHAKFGLAVGIGVAVVSFGFALSSMGSSPAGYEVAAAAAYLIASIIVELVFFVIGLIVPVGTLIVLFVELVDIILLVLSYIFDDIPKTIQGAITEAIADALYDFDVYADNMEDENRLILDFDWDLANPELGYVKSNALIFSTTVTNTLWTDSFSRDDLKRNSFEFALSEDNTALDGVTLGVNYNQDEWENLSYDDYVLLYPDAEFYGDKGVRFTRTVTTALLFSDVGTGININTADTYFLEKYRLLGEGCWRLFSSEGNIDCTEYPFKDTAETELPNFTFDILPDSLAEFVDLRWNSSLYDTPDQYDQDGDGLINQAYNGADPNDEDADSDDDGIHDYFEIVDGYDPEAADGDGDGLNDWEERYLYNTDPTLADSDNDGLSDYAEAKTGWLIAYTTSGGTQTTRIWSDPNVDDIDDDGLGDLQEMIYGFNPNVANDSSAIDNLIKIEDIELDEVGGPLFLLKLEENEDETVVTDASGYNQDFTCSSPSQCPEMGVDGVYGNALSFDGSNDQITSANIDGNMTEFTLAAWIYPNSGANNSLSLIMGDIIGNSAASKEVAPSLYIDRENWVQATFGDGFKTYSATASGALTTDSWNHVASTFDGTWLTVYVNGTAVINTPSAVGKIPPSFSEYHLGHDGYNNYFSGQIDEALLYDRALSQTEIDDVMNGRYNVNDLIVQPGAELSYQATITNTSASRDANGFLYANSNIVNPEVAEPVLATGFENDQRLAYFRSVIETHPSEPNVAEGGTLYCIDNGTCPTAGATGAFNNSLQFDGVDDVVYVPKLTSDITDLHGDENHIFFWIYVEAYPSSGNAMILDTDDNSTAAMDIYLDSSGYLHFDSVGYADGSSLNPIPLQTWTHIGYRDGENLTINAGDDGEGDIVATNSDDSAQYPIWGPGRLGNSLDGSQPFSGRIDELVIFHGAMGDDLV
ncbi:MAG: LamG domain-containing protein, partial [Chloroflexota bacterium]